MLTDERTIYDFAVLNKIIENGELRYADSTFVIRIRSWECARRVIVENGLSNKPLKDLLKESKEGLSSDELKIIEEDAKYYGENGFSKSEWEQFEKQLSKMSNFEKYILNESQSD